MSEPIDVRPDPAQTGVVDEKDKSMAFTEENGSIATAVKQDLNVTEDDLLEAKEAAASFTLEYTRDLMSAVRMVHKKDPNFPMSIIERINEFLDDEGVFENPEKHEDLIAEMKLEAALITNNSPYAEVRGVVDNHDDPDTPCSTIRAWVMGVFFSAAIAFVNGFFTIRLPAIAVTSNVPQLLSYPLGKFLDKTLPDVGFTLFGVRHSLNPGPFNKKEHMLVTIMASIAKSVPYVNYIFWIQYLPQYFNQPWALNFGYQIMIALSTTFIGYGLAGLCRRFLVYPSYCVWPQSLVTIALNAAFHDGSNHPVLGPFKKIYHASRFKFFSIAFCAMFVYFWFPNSIFAALSYFSWMIWISPGNTNLNIITGGYQGIGLNPFPTWDWNIVAYLIDPLMVPFFTTFNYFIGALATMLVVIGIYYSNAWNTGYLSLNSNAPFDNTGAPYNISAIVDERGIFDAEKYQAYSQPYLTAGNTTVYLFFFCTYSAVLTYAALYHWREITMGVKDIINSFRPSMKGRVEQGRVLDVHNRLMKRYKEVPDWWFGIVLVISIVLGCVAIAHWPTNTSPAVVIYGVVLCLIFMVPVGIVFAMTGVEVTLNVLAEFIGGSFVEGNAIAMCFFKVYGYITCLQALSITNDMKLAHYLKIPPRVTFWAQMVPTLVSTFVCVGILQYQVHLDDICTENAPFRFTCPGVTAFFTAAILWGTVGPKRLWGTGGQYTATLVGFPIGACLVLLFWYLGNRFPRSRLLRNSHPVVMFNGGLIWSPYNMAYLWPAVPVAFLSWVVVKKRFLAFWSKYNFVLSAAFSAAIALSGLVQFFALAYNNITIDWWGNRFLGCSGTDSCTVKTLAPGDYFGPPIGHFNQ